MSEKEQTSIALHLLSEQLSKTLVRAINTSPVDLSGVRQIRINLEHHPPRHRIGAMVTSIRFSCWPVKQMELDLYPQ